jgi:hypothetical protein
MRSAASERNSRSAVHAGADDREERVSYPGKELSQSMHVVIRVLSKIYPNGAPSSEDVSLHLRHHQADGRRSQPGDGTVRGIWMKAYEA